MWGEGFLSPGGPAEVVRILQGVDLSDQGVLDIGSGLGGIDILLATTHGAASVTGIDVERPLVERAVALAARVGAEMAAQRLKSSTIKLQVVDGGELRPTHFRARKPRA